MALRVVLFLCTGNYYRSRFAECLFNNMAEQRGLGWRADSRGLALERLTKDGAMSEEARVELARRGVVLDGAAGRRPLGVGEADWAGADLVIGLRGEEHRPLVEQRHPRWCGRVEYWEVGDVDVTTVEDGLEQVARRVEELVGRLVSRKAEKLNKT